MKKLALIAAAALLLTAGISQAAETAAPAAAANSTMKVEKVEKTEKHAVKHHIRKHHAKHAAHAEKKPASDVSGKVDGAVKTNQ